MDNKLEQSLSRCQEFLLKTDSGQIKVVKNLITILKRKAFRICVAGGFSRGKSHFLNFLLGARLLPESALPCTTSVTILRFAENPEIIARGKNEAKTYPFSAEILERFSALEETDKREKIIEVMCPMPLLKNGMELIDTPGVDDSESTAMELSCDALYNSDAAIILVSAIAPLGLTEKDFLQNYLVERSTPLVAFAISFLDQIPEENRNQQIKYILDKIHAIAPFAHILLPEAAGIILDNPNLISGRDAILAFLSKWEMMPLLALYREKMIYERLLASLGVALAALNAKKKLLEKNLDNARHAVTSAMADLKAGSLITYELKMMFMERFEELMEFARASVESFSEKMLKEAENGEFNENKFCVDFSSLYNDLIEHAANYLQKDMDRLTATLHERFQTPAELNAEPELSFPQFSVTRLEQKRKIPAEYIEVAIRRGLIIGDLFARKLPLGAMLWPLVKPQILQLANRLKELLQNVIKDNSPVKAEINSNAARMLKVLREQFESVYEEMFEKARKNAQDWLDAQEKNLLKIHDTENLENQRKETEALLLNGYSLRDEVEAGLKEVEKSL